jgi:hypothetical protein
MNNNRLDLLTKHAPQPTFIYQINLTSNTQLSLQNNRHETQEYLIHENDLKEELDVFVFAKRVIVQNQCRDVNTSMIFQLINYFVGKGYRVTQNRGEDQIQFLRND